MAIPKLVTAQRDFSGGEVDASIARDDDNPLFKTGARQMRNWRILNSKKPQNRPGRSLFGIPTGSRVDKVAMSPTAIYFLEFGNGTLKVYNVAFGIVFSAA